MEENFITWFEHILHYQVKFIPNYLTWFLCGFMTTIGDVWMKILLLYKIPYACNDLLITINK
jgi:hypothetical protein